MTEKAARVPTEVARAAARAVPPERPDKRRATSAVKDRIVARLKRLHPMD